MSNIDPPLQQYPRSALPPTIAFLAQYGEYVESRARIMELPLELCCQIVDQLLVPALKSEPAMAPLQTISNSTVYQVNLERLQQITAIFETNSQLKSEALDLIKHTDRFDNLCVRSNRPIRLWPECLNDKVVAFHDYSGVARDPTYLTPFLNLYPNLKKVLITGLEIEEEKPDTIAELSHIVHRCADGDYLNTFVEDDDNIGLRGMASQCNRAGQPIDIVVCPIRWLDFLMSANSDFSREMCDLISIRPANEATVYLLESNAYNGEALQGWVNIADPCHSATLAYLNRDYESPEDDEDYEVQDWVPSSECLVLADGLDFPAIVHLPSRKTRVLIAVQLFRPSLELLTREDILKLDRANVKVHKQLEDTEVFDRAVRAAKLLRFNQGCD